MPDIPKKVTVSGSWRTAAMKAAQDGQRLPGCLLIARATAARSASGSMVRSGG